MSKSNKNQLIIFILISVNLLFSMVLLFLIFRANSGINYLTERGTRISIILNEKIQCAKDPSNDCQEKISTLERDFSAWNEKNLK